MLRLVMLVAAVFAKVGLFTLGGGLAVIAIVQQETLSRGWLSHPEFLDILAVAQVTPGPMGVNAATFTGWRTAVNAGGGLGWAFAGALAATLAVMAASVVGVVFAGSWFSRNKEKPLVKAVFAVLRPAVAGVIFAVGINLVLAVFGAGGADGSKCIYDVAKLRFDAIPTLVCLGTFVLTVTRRFSPLWGLLAGGLIAAIA